MPICVGMVITNGSMNTGSRAIDVVIGERRRDSVVTSGDRCRGGTPCVPFRQTFVVRRRQRSAVGLDTAIETQARETEPIQTVERLRRRSSVRVSPVADCLQCCWRSLSAVDVCSAWARCRLGPPAARADVAESCSRDTRLGTARRTPSHSADSSADIRETVSAILLAQQVSACQ